MCVNRSRKWFTSREAALELGIHINTLKRISVEELPFYRVSSRGDRRYAIEEIAAYIDRRYVYTEIAK